MPVIEVDHRTATAVNLAADIAKVSAGEIVRRLVERFGDTAAVPIDSEVPVGIHVDYDGRRTQAEFDPATERVDIVDGPLAGNSSKSPSGAAIAVVRHYKPKVNPNRNGWEFWIVTDTGLPLRSIRRR